MERVTGRVSELIALKHFFPFSTRFWVLYSNFQDAGDNIYVLYMLQLKAKERRFPMCEHESESFSLIMNGCHCRLLM